MPRRRGMRKRGEATDKPAKPEARQAEPIVVLFADIIGCSEISNHMNLGVYNAFLTEFHKMFQRVVEKHREDYYEQHERDYVIDDARGDEGCLKIFVPGRDNNADDVDVAIQIALDLKREWLLSGDNWARVKESGLLPSDLAIGIHLGKTFINKEPPGSKHTYRPEGYAINLAKRIEGYSREGQFTHIFVSEAAREALYQLVDESTYSFSGLRAFRPKGISRDIRVFEVKHHFLPTDWCAEKPTEAKKKKSREAPFKPTDDQVDLVKQAYLANPTNLWLAEEYIMLEVQRQYWRLDDEGKEGQENALREAYKDAEEVSRSIATGGQRDAGILTIRGFLLGECKNYGEEQRLYNEAIEFDRQYAEAYWYLAYSMSFELYEKLEDKGRPKVKFEDLKEKGRVKEILANYEKAVELRPKQAWMRFDLACELCRWGREKNAIEQLRHAVDLNPDVQHYIREEPYLKPILDNPGVKSLLP